MDVDKVDTSWSKLFRALHTIAEDGLYRVADERLAEPLRNLVLYGDTRPSPAEGLAHYTSWKNTLRILNVDEGQHPMLRMYNYESASDPEEGSIKPPEWAKLETKAKELLDKYDPQSSEERTRGGSTYGCSFSAGGKDIQDDLMLWRLYGNDGQGCSLKLGWVPEGMYRVRYRDQDMERSEDDETEDKAVADRIDRLLTIGTETIDGAPDFAKGDVGKSIVKVVGRVLDGYCHLVKNRAYQHEREWRMIGVMPEREKVGYDVDSGCVVRRYMEMGAMKDLFSSGSEITVGPRVTNNGAARAFLEMLARRHGMRYTRVKVSAKNYR